MKTNMPIGEPLTLEPDQGARARPRWLLPGLIAGLVAAGLIVAGVVSLNTVLYLGLFGGMLIMHTGGHGGHGGSGHGGAGHSGHGGAGSDGTAQSEDRSGRSPGSTGGPSGSAAGADMPAVGEPNDSETHDHDQHGSNACH